MVDEGAETVHTAWWRRVTYHSAAGMADVLGHVILAGVIASILLPVFVHDGSSLIDRILSPLCEFLWLLVSLPFAALTQNGEFFQKGLAYEFYLAWFALLKSLTLIGASLCLSVPIGAFLGWCVARGPSSSLYTTLFTMLSGLPAFAAGYLVLVVRREWQWPDHFFWPVLVLSLSELTITEMASHVSDELRRELRRPHVLMARMLGRSDYRHYWRRFLVAVAETVRPRLPFLLGGILVVERVFNIHGLGRLAYEAANPASGRALDVPRVIAVCVLAVLVVRLAAFAERLAKALLIPQPLPEMSLDSTSEPGGPSSEGSTALPRVGADVKRAVRHAGVQLRRYAQPRELAAATAGLMRRMCWSAVQFFGSPQTTWPQRIEYALVGAAWSAMVLTVLASLAASLVPETGLLGAEVLGRDLLCEILYAGRRSLLPWTAAIAGPLLLGTFLGAIAGYCDRGPMAWTIKGLIGGLRRDEQNANREGLERSRADRAAVATGEAGRMRSSLLCRLAVLAIDGLINVLDSIPRILLVLAAAIVFGRTAEITVLMPIMGLLFTPLVYHRVREKVRYLKDRNFVEAERTLGLSGAYVLFGHIVKNNCRSILVIQGSLIWGYMILLDVTRGYLGLDQTDFTTWGSLFARQLREVGLASRHLPAACRVLVFIMVFVCGFAYIGEALRRHPRTDLQA